MAVWCDRIVTGGLLFLIVFTPFAFGSVHPWAYGLMEIVIFSLVLVWMTKLLVVGEGDEGLPVLPKKLWVPLVGFLGLVGFQLLPLPPSLLHLVSPKTYELYQVALPGWPERAPFAEALELALEADSERVAGNGVAMPGPILLLPREEEAEGLSPERLAPAGWERPVTVPALPPAERRDLENWVRRGDAGGVASWRPISVSPRHTWATFLKVLAYVAVFLLVFAYMPEGGLRARRRFERRLLRTLVFTACAVAAVGLLQRFTWNGKILWFFVPWDWGEPRPDRALTTGPFVSYNNFAGYLGMLLPLALVPALVPTFLDLKGGRRATRVVFGGAAAVIATAVLWSLSRGGWIATAVGIAVVVGVARWRSDPSPLEGALVSTKAVVVAFATVALAVAALVLVPTESRYANVSGNDIDMRLEESLNSTKSWDSRVSWWRDSIPMFIDHPVLGVGLSAWGEAFPRYDMSPRMGIRAYRTHNDYIQALCEVGLLGVFLLAGVLAAGIRSLLKSDAAALDHTGPVILALVGGIACIAVHEFVDFDLQMTAISMAFVMLFALAPHEASRPSLLRPLVHRRFPSTGWVLVAVLLVLACVQSGRITPQVSRGDTIWLLQEAAMFPTSAKPRIALGEKILSNSPEASKQFLEAAAAIDPRGPKAQDALLAWLAAFGNDAETLALLEDSIASSPNTASHPYLEPGKVRWLSEKERTAIERGFIRAAAKGGYREAAALASFRRSFERYEPAAEASKHAASHAPSQRAAAMYLRIAGTDHIRADRLDAARSVLETAISADPVWPWAYVTLIARVYGRRGDIESARVTHAAGVAAGADARELDLALAEAFRMSERPEMELEVLTRLASAHPSEARGQYRLGLSHYRAGDWARAAEFLGRAVGINSNMAAGWYYLGRAEEKRYRFPQALQAFERSVVANPLKVAYKKNLDRFRARLEEASN